MAQPGPNFGRTGLAHLVGPILPPLVVHTRIEGLCCSTCIHKYDLSGMNVLNIDLCYIG